MVAAIRDVRLTGETRDDGDRTPNPRETLLGFENGVVWTRVAEYSMEKMEGGAKWPLRF
jgi:hypothetical protein